MSDKKTPADNRLPALAGKRTVLVIIDGFGISPDKNNNAIYLAKTPNLDALFSNYPHTYLEASGAAVGLPDGQIGNSEVGHMTMGCGSVIEQDLVRINAAIASGAFFENQALLSAIETARAAKRPLHLWGLMSDGGVHSHIRHLEALIELCRQREVRPLLHMITDGRDTAPICALDALKHIEPLLEQAQGSIATVMGRFYAMDRDHRWERTEVAWRAIARADGEQASDARTAVLAGYARRKSDEFILPTVLPAATPLRDGDAMILFNFRNDRPRQLLKALMLEEFDKFERSARPRINMVTMTEIDKAIPCDVAFDVQRPKTTLSKIVSDAGLQQFHCAETEKYPHVTFFFNGGEEKRLPGETRHMVDSPKVHTYDLKPEMSIVEVTDEVVAAIRSKDYAFIVVNFANADMVGHTAVRDAVIKAVESVDEQIGRVTEAALESDSRVVITSDHGNCDEMMDSQTRQPNTRHTANPVPCLIVGKNLPRDMRLASGNNISCITPTVLDLLGLDAPPEIDSPSLIVGN